MNQNFNNTPKPKSIREFFKAWYIWKPLIAIIIGALGGYLFFYYQLSMSQMLKTKKRRGTLNQILKNELHRNK